MHMRIKKWSTVVRPVIFASLAAYTAMAVLPVATQSLNVGVAFAQEGEKPPEKTRKTQAISAKVYEKLAKAQEAAEAKQYDEAISILDALRRSRGDKLQGYDAASVWNVYGFIYYSKEQYRKAIDSYKKVVAQQDIPDALNIATRYTLAQLNFVIEDYPAAVRALKDWFKVSTNPGPDPYILLGQAYYQTKDYRNALASVEKGMAVAKERGKPAKEHWYLLLRVLYYEKNDYKKTAEVLEQLVRTWPKREYWVQLAGMYGELKKDKQQMIVMETAYVQNMLTREGELLNMAYLFLANDMPYKAAKVVSKALKEGKMKETSKTWELLGNAYHQAQESKKAIPAYESAAKLAEKGEIYSRLAGVYLDSEQYGKSIEAANKAFAKGGVKRRDNLWIVKGMAEFNSGKLNSAQKSFRNARKDKRSEKVAAQWLNYLSKEIKRKEQLAKDLKALEETKKALAKRSRA